MCLGLCHQPPVCKSQTEEQGLAWLPSLEVLDDVLTWEEKKKITGLGHKIVFICRCSPAFIEEIDYPEKCVLFIVLSDGGVVSRSHNFIVRYAAPAVSPRRRPGSQSSGSTQSFIHRPLTETNDVPGYIKVWLYQQKSKQTPCSWSGWANSHRNR